MSQEDDCPVCQLTMILPTALPGCNHKYCFMCIKSVAVSNPDALCPICRGPIDRNIFNRPRAHGVELTMRDPESPVVARTAAGCSTSASNRSSGGTRKRIKDEPEDDEENPAKKKDVDTSASDAQDDNSSDTKYYWLYEGRGGWWRFDPRLEKDLEGAKEAGMPLMEATICGMKYIVDFNGMFQYSHASGPRLKRDIKRVDEEEFGRLNIKGIAGMHIS